MTDEEAFILIRENIRLLRDTYHWGVISVEVKEGIVKRINLTVNVKPKRDRVISDDDEDYRGIISL